MAASASSLLEDKENQRPLPIISFIKSQKGKPLLVLDKHIFKLNRSSTTTKYWMCTVIECTAKVHTNVNDVFIRMIDEHCHIAEEEQLDVRKFREKVKQRAIDETTLFLVFTKKNVQKHYCQMRNKIYIVSWNFRHFFTSIFFLSTFLFPILFFRYFSFRYFRYSSFRHFSIRYFFFLPNYSTP